MVYDDPMGDDHDEQGKPPKHCRRKYKVCELLKYKIFCISFYISLELTYFLHCKETKF